MGKASSSKKVARAARAAGRPGGGRGGVVWPAAVVLVVIGGILLIVVSRGENEDAARPILGDHWHAAYGIYDCGGFLPPLNDVADDVSGIHTHGDGLIHMHPFSTGYTGAGANLNAWGETTGLVLTDTSISAAGIDRENGDSCDDEEGTVQLMVWDSPEDETGELIEEDLGEYAPQEFQVLTIAFVPEGSEIPKPPEQYLEELRAPSDVPGNEPPDDGETPTSAPGATTTVPGATTTTAPTTQTTATTETTEPTSTTAP